MSDDEDDYLSDFQDEQNENLSPQPCTIKRRRGEGRKWVVSQDFDSYERALVFLRNEVSTPFYA